MLLLAAKSMTTSECPPPVSMSLKTTFVPSGENDGIIACPERPVNGIVAPVLGL